MESYLLRTKPSQAAGAPDTVGGGKDVRKGESGNKGIHKAVFRSKPYARPITSVAQVKASTKEILSTLSSGPITKPTPQMLGTMHIVSCSSGHQQRNSGFTPHAGSGTTYVKSRQGKLKAQGAEQTNGVFSGVRAYINGFTGGDVGNLELIRIIQEGGGDVKYAYSVRGVTHVITAMPLCGSKTEREIKSKKNKHCIVHPNWVLDSHSKGKRQQEHNYPVVVNELQPNITTAFSRAPSSSSSSAPISSTQDAGKTFLNKAGIYQRPSDREIPFSQAAWGCGKEAKRWKE
ncbi:hypothetical protein BT69DRAFT_1292952 [Atractiella rhizophila]|nr:hypothetical protein BT69DRAFT_1292952 [Atractiella rhizophila]